ncbi:MAG: hypothetical protein FJ149_00895 [Euryarchaeota archaeon]|nr:hypothetical protein [Euryarchaeota archaeon]
MKKSGNIGTLLVTLGFLLSVLAVAAPAGAASGRAEQFAVDVEFTNPDGSHDNSSEWMETEPVNITATVSIASLMENATDLVLTLSVDGTPEGDPVSMGALDADQPAEHTWQWYPPTYGDYEIMVTAVNATETENQTVVTVHYRSMASDFTVESVALSASEALIGVDTVTITASLTNDGNLDGTVTVSFGMDADVMLGERDITLAAGEGGDSALETDFSGLGLADGEHTVWAKILEMDPVMAGTNISLTSPMANITITGLAVSPASGYEGETVTFTVTLMNDGTAAADNITIDFSEFVILVYMPVGELPNVTVPEGETVNATWDYVLPEITGGSETKTIRAGYGEGLFLSTYMTVNVTVKKRMPVLEVTSFSMPADKRVNDFVEVSISVKNNGTANATGVVVKLRQGGWEYTNVTEPFNLSIGESKTVTLGISLNDEVIDGNQTYTAVAIVGGVESKKDSTVFVARQIYAAIGIQSFKISPAKKDNQPKDSSQSFTATVTLKNIGEKAGSVQLMLMEGTGASAKLLANQTVSVDPLSTKEVKVSFKVKGAGKHTITSVVSLPNPDPGNMTKQATCELQYSSPGFEVAILVAAILAVAVLVRRRKN